MPYMVQGTIGANGINAGRAGKFTYLARIGHQFYIWDGLHAAAHFESEGAALTAAGHCNGPWFNMPDPATIEAVGHVEARNLDRSGLNDRQA